MADKVGWDRLKFGRKQASILLTATGKKVQEKAVEQVGASVSSEPPFAELKNEKGQVYFLLFCLK